MIVALRQGSERAGLFLYILEEHPPQGAASGEQQQRWQPGSSRLLLDAVFGVMRQQPFGSWHLRRAQRYAVPPAERASYALRCA